MRPFNLEHAKAGAPVRLSDGTESVRIICFDKASVVPPGSAYVCIIALVGGPGVEHIREFYNDGQSAQFLNRQPDLRLVMKPLGTCQGREVHWGDKLVDAAGTVMVGNDWTQEDFDQCTWPAQYPTTRMEQHELADINVHRKTPWPAYLLDVANAAIKHGIDNGYLFAAPPSVPSDDELLQALVGDKTVPDLPAYARKDALNMARRIWNLKRGV